MVFAEVAKLPEMTGTVTHTFPPGFFVESLHKAVSAKCIRNCVIVPLQAEPAHVMGNQCASHTSISTAAFPCDSKILRTEVGTKLQLYIDNLSGDPSPLVHTP